MKSYRAITLLLIFFSYCIFANKPINDSCKCILYITANNIVFVYNEGFIPIGFYKKVNGEYCLYSESRKKNNSYKGIYDKNDVLFLNKYKHYCSIDNFKSGDTIFPLSSLRDSSVRFSLFNPNDFSEKQVSIYDYFLITVSFFKSMSNDNYDSLCFNLIIDPSVKDSAMIKRVEVFFSDEGYAYRLKTGTYEKALDQIKENYPEGDVPDVFENDCIAKERYRKNKELYQKQKSGSPVYRNLK